MSFWHTPSDAEIIQSMRDEKSSFSISQDSARDAIRTMLQFIGEDPDREGLRDTPDRVVRAWSEMTIGYSECPKAILSTDFAKRGYNQMILIRRYPFVSICEHHMLPFIGHAAVAYLPGRSGRVVGLSKLGRLVDCFARRLQIQEAMTEQIADALESAVRPRGIGVQIVAVHQCMSCRGVNKSAEMVTCSLRGRFWRPEVRAEFLGQV